MTPEISQPGGSGSTGGRFAPIAPPKPEQELDVRGRDERGGKMMG